MSEQETINRSFMPNTKASIVQALRRLGVQEGDTSTRASIG